MVIWQRLCSSAGERSLSRWERGVAKVVVVVVVVLLSLVAVSVVVVVVFVSVFHYFT